MTRYRVRLFKLLVNSQGMQFKTIQREMEIAEAKTALEAEAIAEREFERVRDIPDWHIHADSVESEVVVTPARKSAA
jgi:predicted DNA-binding transcriptional regulator